MLLSCLWPLENCALHVKDLPLSLAVAAIVSVETYFISVFPSLETAVKTCMLSRFHVIVGGCLAHVYKAVQWTWVGWPSLNSLGDVIVKGIKTPGTTVVLVSISAHAHTKKKQ